MLSTTCLFVMIRPGAIAERGAERFAAFHDPADCARGLQAAREEIDLVDVVGAGRGLEVASLERRHVRNALGQRDGRKRAERPGGPSLRQLGLPLARFAPCSAQNLIGQAALRGGNVQ